MSLPHQHGGVCTTQGAAISTCADKESSVASAPGAVASITPTGRPSGVQWVGSETAGLPVTFHIEVYGVNRFCASKSAAGSASSRIAPTGSGGAASVGVSTASYGESAVSAAAATLLSSPMASPNSGPLTASPRSASHVVSGRSSARPSAGRLTTDKAVSTAQHVSKTGTASGGSGMSTSTTSWPS